MRLQLPSEFRSFLSFCVFLISAPSPFLFFFILFFMFFSSSSSLLHSFSFAPSSYQRMVDANNAGANPCPYCGKTFLTPSFLLAHCERRHEEQKPFDIQLRKVLSFFFLSFFFFFFAKGKAGRRRRRRRRRRKKESGDDA